MMIARHVRRLKAYVPGEQPKAADVVKLNTNENPYPPSPKCAAALATFDTAALRRYPDPVFSELREVIARLNGTTTDRVFVGNGSDEILSLAARAFVENDECIASLNPSYSLYKTLAAIRGVKWVAGGDGFTGGLLYGVISGWDAEKCLRFGWAAGVLAASSLNDYAEPADEKQVWDVYAGNARVQR